VKWKEEEAPFHTVARLTLLSKSKLQPEATNRCISMSRETHHQTARPSGASIAPAGMARLPAGRHAWRTNNTSEPVTMPSILQSAADLAMVVPLLALAAACNVPTTGTRPPVASSADAPTDEAIGQLLAPWTGDLPGMMDRRYIRMLVTFSKTNYFLDGPQQHGITYDAGKAFEAFVNARLKSRHITVHVAFIPVARDRILQALAEGRGDIAAANLTVTPQRQKLVDFARPFVGDVQELVVTAPDQPPVARAEDLAGREIHVRRSSAYYDSLQALNARLTAAGRPPVRIVEAGEHLEDEDLLEMVNVGLIPATVADNHVVGLWQQVFKDMRVQSGAVLRTGGQIAWALRRGTPELRAVVDAFAAANPKGSLAFNTLVQRYFKDTKWVTNAASKADVQKFQRMVALFKRYGDQYDLPYLLVAAQAYQESQIDQSRRSPAGAVGVMQIKPSTAAADPINVLGVDKSAEKNIQAGVKYLRFIADRYYKNEPMDRLNKGLFSMASYNAGPARIAALRRKASNIQLDPNQWFGNVEVVAARETGRETVQYVANIYKYYIAYTLIEEQREIRRREGAH
jgi:membrane-bound lytic murein transglycosylase MltF